MTTLGLFGEEPRRFEESQRPALPGAPARPPQPPLRRVGYAIIGMLAGITSGLAATLVSSNAGYLLGTLDITAAESTWLSTAYLMTYVSMNLLLVRARQQFGLRMFALAGLALFCVVTAAHELVDGLGGAIVIHALAGVATAPLLAMSTYYMMAAASGRYALNGAAFAIGLSQTPTPMSRLFATDVVTLNQWSHLYHIELGLGLLTLVGIALMRLPPSERSRVFEPVDFVTWILLAPGLALLTAAIGMGRVEWWTDRLWIGWVLIAAVPLIAAGLLVEYHRARPLIDLRFLSSTGLLRFGLVMIVLRIVLAEQTVLGFGLLGSAGLITMNLRFFSAALTFASLMGAVSAGLLFRPDRITAIGAIAFLMIAISAAIDSGSTSLTRVPQLYVTQMAIAFATSFAVGPSLLYGITRVMMAGGGTLASFMVLFAIVQNVGNLIGTSLLSTLQVFHTQAASVALIARAPDYDPSVQARLFLYGGGQPAASALARELNGQASVIAYNEGFAVVSVLALLAAGYMVARYLIDRRAAMASTPR